MVICPEQDCEWIAYMTDLDTCMVEALGIHEIALWSGRVQDFKEWQAKTTKSSKSSKAPWTWEGSSSEKWSTTSTRGSSKRGQSVPLQPDDITSADVCLMLEERIRKQKLRIAELIDAMGSMDRDWDPWTATSRKQTFSSLMT